MKLISVFDCETGPASEDVLATVKPVFVANKTLKDPEKIAADLAAKELDWREKAALDATTGMVLCIPVADGLASIDVIHAGDEKANIERFWNWLELRLARSEPVVGFNIFGFDLPFLYRRSWILGVEIPRMIRKGRYWHEDLIDLMDVWKLGNYDQRISLDMLAKSLGLGEKTGNGADFAALWASDREKAISYAKTDVELTRKCAERMLGLK
jgi:hypothetical protein